MRRFLGHLSATVGLHNVADVDAFVCAAIRKHPHMSQTRGAEREDLEGAGFLIMCELERKYTPTHARKWSFSTYAGQFLSGRLVDEWHKMNRGKHVRRHTTGAREWDYRVILSYEQCFAAPDDGDHGERTDTTFSEVGLRRVGEFSRVAA